MHRKIIALCLLVLFTVVTTQPLMAQINWRFDISGMYFNQPRSYNKGEFEHWSPSLDFGSSLVLQIPLKHIENPFFIETGVQFLMKRSIYNKYYDWNSYQNDKYLQMPLKLGWRKHLKGSNWLEFSMGPYAAYNIDYSGVSVGIQPAVVFRHRCVSVGISYQNPIFYDQNKDLLKHTVMLSFGLNFGNKAWKWIGIGAMTAATLGSAAATVYGATRGQTYSSTSDHSSSSRSSSYSSSGSDDSGSDFSLSEQTSRNIDKRTYERYDSDLALIFSGNRNASLEDIRTMQENMKKLREKWEKRGKGWTKLPNETRGQ